MDNEIDEVTIVGGGDSGLLAALCIRKLNPELEITVVDDFQSDIPQVGKSTYEKITEILHGFLEIDEEEFIATVKPIWKGSVYFRDWCDYEPFHFPFDNSVKFPTKNTPDSIEAFFLQYDELYRSPDHLTKGERIAQEGKSPMSYVPRSGKYRKYEQVAYHLNTNRFNSFLRELCRDRDISLIDDEITEVETAGDRVEAVRSKSQRYEGDLFVDASGFNRVIKSELGGEFRDFAFPLDSAYTTRVERPLSEVVSATVVESGPDGWFWQIDTYDNRDLGYVYASEYVTDEAARAEFIEHCGGDVSPDAAAKYEFSSGYYRDAWAANCVVIGNAGGFVEPLQSTGLTTNAWAAVVLSNMLASHGRINYPGIRDTYNSWIRRAWESIYDFVSVHYKYANGDTEFWRDVQSMETSDRVGLLREEFDSHGFSTFLDYEKSPLLEDLVIFRPENFYVMMRNMGVESAFYEDNDFSVSPEVRAERDEFYRSIEEDVEDHLTTEEVYKGIPQFADAD